MSETLMTLVAAEELQDARMRLQRALSPIEITVGAVALAHLLEGCLIGVALRDYRLADTIRLEIIAALQKQINDREGKPS